MPDNPPVSLPEIDKPETGTHPADAPVPETASSEDRSFDLQETVALPRIQTEDGLADDAATMHVSLSLSGPGESDATERAQLDVETSKHALEQEKTAVLQPVPIEPDGVEAHPVPTHDGVTPFGEDGATAVIDAAHEGEAADSPHGEAQEEPTARPAVAHRPGVRPAAPIGEPGLHRPASAYPGMDGGGYPHQPFGPDQTRGTHGRFQAKSESDRIGMMAAAIAAVAVVVAGIVFFFAIVRPLSQASQPQVQAEPQTALSHGLVLAVVENVEFPEVQETVVDHDEPSAQWKGGTMDFYFGASTSYASGYSTPVIVKVTNYTKGSESTSYFSMEPNVHESHDVPEGEIGIRFIGPINQDGTMYAGVDVAPRVDGEEGSATVESGRYLDSPTDEELDAAVEEIVAAVDSGDVDSYIGDLARQNREYATYYSSSYSYDYTYDDGTAYDDGTGQYGDGYDNTGDGSGTDGYSDWYGTDGTGADVQGDAYSTDQWDAYGQTY